MEQDPTARLKRYLVLPDFDTLPPFWEGWKSRSTWNVVIVELLNSVIFCVTIFSWGQLLGSEGWILPAIGALLWLACQYCLHRIMLSRSEKNYEEVYKVKFTEPFCPSDKKKVIGVDLDGVLNDLAGAVIEVAQSRFRLTIDRADIVSHRLQECTDLTSNQVEEIFASSDVFQIAKPVKGAKEALAQLRSTGWVIHVVTDRFWGTNDWTVARDWLVEHGFDWDHLNLIHAEEKAAYAETFGITVFIEDNYSTAVDLSSVCERVYLTDRTYNKGDLPEKACRVTDWQQVLDDLG